MRGPGSAKSRHHRPLRVCFLAEQVLGHRSIVANLRRPLDTGAFPPGSAPPGGAGDERIPVGDAVPGPGWAG